MIYSRRPNHQGQIHTVLRAPHESAIAGHLPFVMPGLWRSGWRCPPRVPPDEGEEALLDARVVGHRLLLPELPGGADHLRLRLHPGEGIGDEGLVETVVDPAIIHWAGARKPWTPDYVPLKELWTAQEAMLAVTSHLEGRGGAEILRAVWEELLPLL